MTLCNKIFPSSALFSTICPVLVGVVVIVVVKISFLLVLFSINCQVLISIVSRGKGHPHIQEMDHGRDNVGLADLKVNIQRLYEMVAIGIMDSRETAKEVKTLVDVVGYTSYQIINHDARIDDNEMNLKEFMGKVDRIQEDLQRLVQLKLNRGSQSNENLVGVVQNMVEEFVTQPMGKPGNP